MKQSAMKLQKNYVPKRGCLWSDDKQGEISCAVMSSKGTTQAAKSLKGFST
jgi:hypothetical protein